MDIISWGLVGLFSGSFLSATLIPFPSEGMLIGYFELGYSVWTCVFVATTANTLGGLTNYALGRFGSSEYIVIRFKLNEKKLNNWAQRFSKYGHFIGLLAWLPIVGDPMIVVLGFFKVKFWPLALMILIGKFLRYVALAMIYISIVS